MVSYLKSGWCHADTPKSQCNYYA